MTKTIRRPARLLWLIPVLSLQLTFDDATIGLYFGLLMGFATAKIFPWIEYVEENDKT